ncbi:MAG: ATP-binding protein, partial [Bacteroidota bacterium]
NMSHEMRTPLNAVVGMGALLGDAGLTGESAGHLRALRGAADALLALINDLLDLTKIESGEILFEQVPFEPREVLAGVTEMVQFAADAKGLRLEVVVDEAVPPVLIGDPNRVRQVILNLVGNAVKFTEEGEVAVQATLAGRDGPTCRLRIAVRDTGIGISEAQQEAIFDRFTQASSDTTRRYGGTGLGLAIVRELTERQGGTVTLESASGEGSTFTVEIPFAVGEGLAPESESAPADLSGARLLLVEDNVLNQAVARQMLERWGAEVTVAENGRLGVEAVLAASGAGTPFDLVLMDVQMPEMDGFEATRRIRERFSSADLPVLALTASALVEQREQMDAAGMDDLVLKPFRPDHLRARIAAHLGDTRRASGDSLPPEAPGAAGSASGDLASGDLASDDLASDAAVYPTDVLDLSALSADTGGDAAFVLHVLDLFAQVAPEASGDIRRATEARDGDALARAAHKLKSSAGILGAADLHAALSALETAARDDVPEGFGGLSRDALAHIETTLAAVAALRPRVEDGSTL